MHVRANATAGLAGDLDDRDVPRGAPVDMLHSTHVRNGDRALIGADDPRRRRVAHQEPGGRDVEGGGDLPQHGERWRRLVVLDLRQVPDGETAPLGYACQGEPALDAPSPDLAANEKPR